MRINDLATPLLTYQEKGVLLARPVEGVVIGYTTRDWTDACQHEFYPVKGLKGYLRQIQRHTNVVVFEQTSCPTQAFDASYTQRILWQLNGVFADCLPIYMGNKEGNWIGLAHSGWRGSLGLIAKNLLESLMEVYPSSSSQWWAVLGPYRWGKDYEVQNEFKELFFSQFSYSWLDRCFEQKNKTIYFDNGLFNLYLLDSLGLKDLSYMPFNTANHRQLYSHRRGEKARNLAFIYREGF